MDLTLDEDRSGPGEQALPTLEVCRAEELTDSQIEDLAAILVGVVQAGASVGFVPPLSTEEALAYWRQVLGPSVVLLLARDGARVIGTGQLDLAMRANGRNRAEVCKVLVHPEAQGRGIGKLLMRALEDEARRERRGLLFLDTNAGDTPNRLYLSMGYTPVGTIPDWVIDAAGTLRGTTFYYKVLAGGR